jgi:hypothetical protein
VSGRQRFHNEEKADNRKTGKEGNEMEEASE